ncbi:uncharacterized protein LOC141882545 isoform X2 [Acropora palmata]|uniref:uncharacterized protein LOC141882545 isoform X2 n=1 Tax=Acropora palmata TaxID=6131 RepID=UPI003DA0719F
MAGDLNSRKITILLDESKVEELSGWLTVNNGEIVRVDKPRKKNSTPGSQLHLQNEENRSRSRHKDHICKREKENKRRKKNGKEKNICRFKNVVKVK